MSTFSVLGFLLAFLTFLFLTYLLRRPNSYVSNGQKIAFLLIILGLIILAVDPNIVTGVLTLFSFNPGNGGRLIGLTIFAVFVLFLWNTQLQSRLSSLDRTLDRLVREL